jgi:hypothetical protein
MKKTIAVLLASASILGVLGLGLAFAYDGQSTDEAKQEFCDSLSGLSSTVMKYEGLNPATATNDELDAAADDIEDAWDEVVDEAYDWTWAEDNQLVKAYDDLYEAIESLPGDYTVAQSIEALEPELSAFPEAYSATFDGSGCSSTTA